MDQYSEICEEGAQVTVHEPVDAERLAGVGLGLPEGFGKKSREIADRLERRLSRLEIALNLPVID